MLGGLICVVIGSIAGGTARYFVSGLVARRFGETFPWGTVIVNISGAFLIGVFGALATNKASLLALPEPWLLAVTGFLGCYTTVSSFSLQTLNLLRDGQMPRALANIALSLGFCLAAVTCGFTLTEWLGA